MKVLYASSSVGLGHITRDYHISNFIKSKIYWLTSGNALKFIKDKKENYVEISDNLNNLGYYIGSMIKNCKVKINLFNSYKLYKAVKNNANLIKSYVNFDDYDLIIADEFWEFMFIDIPKERSVFITDFTKVSYSTKSYFERFIIPKLNNGLRDRIKRKFTLAINLSIWDNDNEFLNLGPSFTSNFNNSINSKDNYILINIGGTNAGIAIAEKLKEKLEEKYNVKIIGSDKYFNSNPSDLIRNAEIIISLSGYGNIIESNVLKKKTIFVYIDNHFEQIENAKIMMNRKGFRVYSCKDVLKINILHEIENLKKEKIQPLEIKDSAIKVSEIINSFLNKDK
ncbi:MAG: glycosyltransferase [Caldisphaera sp.]|uniref:glycosyltransferase n=1 Tax=Caldisphaera sp. TaxID=2060322 RepID=UPI003D0ABE9E